MQRAKKTLYPQDNQASIDSGILLSPFKNYDKNNFIMTARATNNRNNTSKKEVTKRSQLKNSDIMFFNEFFTIIKRREYTLKAVQRHFTKLQKAADMKV